MRPEAIELTHINAQVAPICELRRTGTWFEQIQVESNEAWELFRMFNSTVSVAEKVTALQDWAKGVTARSANDARYAIETARSPGTIELNLFARKTIDVDESGLTCRHATLQSAQRTASAKR